MDLEITTNAREVADRLRDAAVRLQASWRKAMRSLQPDAERALREQLQGRTLQRRSGRLSDSIRSRLVETSDGVAVEAYAGIGYAGLLRRGGVVTASRAARLAVPRPGVRFSARAFLANPAAFGYSRGFVTPRSIIGIHDDRTFDVLFTRPTSVAIRAFDFAVPAARALEPLVRDRLTNAVEEALRPLGEGGG